MSGEHANYSRVRPFAPFSWKNLLDAPHLCSRHVDVDDCALSMHVYVYVQQRHIRHEICPVDACVVIAYSFLMHIV